MHLSPVPLSVEQTACSSRDTVSSLDNRDTCHSQFKSSSTQLLTGLSSVSVLLMVRSPPSPRLKQESSSSLVRGTSFKWLMTQGGGHALLGCMADGSVNVAGHVSHVFPTKFCKEIFVGRVEHLFDELSDNEPGLEEVVTLLSARNTEGKPYSSHLPVGRCSRPLAPPCFSIHANCSYLTTV